MESKDINQDQSLLMDKYINISNNSNNIGFDVIRTDGIPSTDEYADNNEPSNYHYEDNANVDRQNKNNKLYINIDEEPKVAINDSIPSHTDLIGSTSLLSHLFGQVNSDINVVFNDDDNNEVNNDDVVNGRNGNQNESINLHYSEISSDDNRPNLNLGLLEGSVVQSESTAEEVTTVLTTPDGRRLSIKSMDRNAPTPPLPPTSPPISSEVVLVDEVENISEVSSPAVVESGRQSMDDNIPDDYIEKYKSLDNTEIDINNTTDEQFQIYNTSDVELLTTSQTSIDNHQVTEPITSIVTDHTGRRRSIKSSNMNAPTPPPPPPLINKMKSKSVSFDLLIHYNDESNDNNVPSVETSTNLGNRIIMDYIILIIRY